MTRRGAAVIRYEGKRGVTWKIKWRDADGVQVKQTLGREADGWTERKARTELEARLVDVRRDSLRRTRKQTFATFAAEWRETYSDAHGLKRSTRQGYEQILDRHLIDAFGQLALEAIRPGHITAYVARKRKAGLSPATINRQLNLLSAVLGTAMREELIRANPVSLVERPREARRRWRILSPVEVARIGKAFAQLAEDAEGEERSWREQARTIFLVLVTVGLRRGEVQGLRWRDVELTNPDGPRLRVAETWVRSGTDTPKSEAGERTIPLGPRIADELYQQLARTPFSGADERVFVSPHKGTPFDTARYAETFRLALAKAEVDGYIRPFHDLRHTAITNDAASGNAPLAIMKRAGHASFSTTLRYVDLAGELFREEAERAEARQLGGTTQRYQDTEPSPAEEPDRDHPVRENPSFPAKT